ncbi:acyltransferase family protein [Microbacterium sp. NPDC077184]|uniref:acyltransferase family protein n=1 Tax=Microbacterium sp. NPDC077184 TaxID=3154764 RepID=UPI00341DB440
MASSTVSRRQSTPVGRHVRADIQALRAAAVLAVVLFHLWPGALPGGYVGVDVFFVISGFLITGQLVRLRSENRLRLPQFWAARARRLLPVSLFVLAVSVALTVVWAPPTVQAQYLRSIIGSALYVENWFLAADGIDYLAADNAPPIAQHYWSLSVEEQFYLLWPLLILAVAGRAVFGAGTRRRLYIVLGAASGLSFALSVTLTFVSPPYAYFATPSRIWEFGLGALLALSPALTLRRASRVAIWVTAWGAIVASALFFDKSTPFPGFAALLPTVGTAAIIAAGPHLGVRRLDRAVTTRPIQWIGDQSYGIYLWHWPLIVIAPAVVGPDVDFWERLTILALTLVAAALTTRFVEDPIRFHERARSARPRTVAAFSAIAMAIVITMAVIPLGTNAVAASQREAEVAEQLAAPSGCLGASLLLESECADLGDESIPTDELVPALTSLYEDTGGAFACYDQQPSATLSTCTLGSDASDAVRVAVTGDSHAAMLIPGLRDHAERLNWRVDTFVGRGCVWQDASTAGAECFERQAALERTLASGEYDVILVARWNREEDAEARAAAADGMARAWTEAKERGSTVIGLIDNPTVPESSATCLAAEAEFSSDTCAFAPDFDASAEDPIRAAAALSDAELIDFSSAYCRDGSCPMVAGGVVIYRDLHHITATFSRTLAPYLTEEISAVLGTQ